MPLPLLLLLSLAMFALPVSGATCTAGGSWTCSGCVAPFLLSGTTCGTACPVGTFADTDARKCTQCPTGCTACISTSVCTACTSTLWRTADGRCVAASGCPASTFPATNRVCTACASTWYGMARSTAAASLLALLALLVVAAAGADEGGHHGESTCPP
ncbi:hypothetical protein Rsub_13288 [Raphidocelis subcapitata]|uniref:TNFR-Cys domain-containing protein n=1 Tax=Raphidocelis subcapitata TaxID=307507 RepID=A0A2V0PL85_9CHLO|nr:hypothetical protein Rsub_13288 [Raphidocelis subcapitata]|eukprot:GBG00310.1 hypothetical protein Rsub_13288 [Raphidocelis subcapitata]